MPEPMYQPPDPTSESVRDFLATSLSSSNAPICKESVLKIAQIREARLQEVDPAIRFETTKLFDLVEEIPLADFLFAKNVFQYLAEPEDLVATLLRDLNKLASNPGMEVTPDWNEFGFVPVSINTPDPTPVDPIYIDLQAARRITLEKLPLTIPFLASIDDHELRRQICEDCIAILTARCQLSIEDIPPSSSRA